MRIEQCVTVRQPSIWLGPAAQIYRKAVNTCMSSNEDRERSIELVRALLSQAPQHLTTASGRWIWVTGKLAAMVIRWSRMDMSIRQEVRGIIEKSRRGGRR